MNQHHVYKCKLKLTDTTILTKRALKQKLGFGFK